MSALDRYRPDATGIGPVPVQCWHVKAFLQGSISFTNRYATYKPSFFKSASMLFLVLYEKSIDINLRANTQHFYSDLISFLFKVSEVIEY